MTWRADGAFAFIMRVFDLHEWWSLMANILELWHLDFRAILICSSKKGYTCKRGSAAKIYYTGFSFSTTCTKVDSQVFFHGIFHLPAHLICPHPEEIHHNIVWDGAFQLWGEAWESRSVFLETEEVKQGHDYKLMICINSVYCRKPYAISEEAKTKGRRFRLWGKTFRGNLRRPFIT